jgi:N-acetylmuramoyl-L-alanine amidase
MIRTALPHDFRLSPNVEMRRGDISMLILHYTGMGSAEKACDWLCNPASRVSCHYLVDEAGSITQMVDEDLRAWHAGESCWQGETDINSVSVGIEIQNPGHGLGYPEFPRAQMEAVAELCRDIAARNGIAARRVLAHSDIAPHRKVDPGEKFDWRFLWERGVGHWIEPSPLTPPETVLGDADVRALLSHYGYGTEGQSTTTLLRAFQRHFRPARVDGIADRSTVELLKRLIDEE